MTNENLQKLVKAAEIFEKSLCAAELTPSQITAVGEHLQVYFKVVTQVNLDEIRVQEAGKPKEGWSQADVIQAMIDLNTQP
jgi:hypothetical protein